MFLFGNSFLNFQDLSSVEMGQKSISYKFIWIIIAGFILRHRYYIAFSYGQTAADLSGLSYNSKKGDVQDDRYNDYYLNLDYWGLEIDQRCRGRLKVWNMSTQRWLQSTVYDRTIAEIGSSKAAMLVFLLSSFWHGFYPAWYLVFFSAFWMNE